MSAATWVRSNIYYTTRLSLAWEIPLLQPRDGCSRRRRRGRLIPDLTGQIVAGALASWCQVAVAGLEQAVKAVTGKAGCEQGQQPRASGGAGH